MPLSPEWLDPGVGEGVADAQKLGHFDGPPKDFWSRYLVAVQKLTSAANVALFFKPEPTASWKRAAQVRGSAKGDDAAFASSLEGVAAEIAAHAEEHDGCVLAPRELLAKNELPNRADEIAVLAVAPPLHESSESCLIVSIVEGFGESEATEALIRLKLAAAIPETYQRNLGGRRAGEDVKKIATALDVNVLVNRENKFLAAALAFCNGLAAQLACDRVSLGWVENGLIRLRAISRTEKFDHKMEAAQQMEAAMDEALDQDDEIVWPGHDSAPTIARDHERFATAQNSGHVASLPLRIDDEPKAVVTVERKADPFTEVELQQLRLACDLVAPRLGDLKISDRWFGARAATRAREAAAKLLGPSHTWAKIAALLGCVALVVLVFVHVPYRVEADFVLRSDEVSYMTSPFDGYIAEVHVRAGDEITSGAPLLSLDRTQLELERASARADLARYQRETEKARADGNLAEMRISDSLAEQARVRLELVEHRLTQSDIVAPFDAYVVEGDQRDRIGASVSQGDVLFRLARIDSMHVEAKVDERDVHEITSSERGEIAFVSRPAEKFAVTIENVVPAAVPDPAGNTFLVRCQLDAAPDDWARPGMSGVCKLEGGKRSLGWILTHRTVDFLRMFFWW